MAWTRDCNNGVLMPHRTLVLPAAQPAEEQEEQEEEGLLSREVRWILEIRWM
jgi:hypothetical protein